MITGDNMNNDCKRSTELFRETADLDFFKAFFEPTRYDLIEFIWMHPNKSITEIANEFRQDRSVISRHLEVLYRHNILLKTKESRYTFYSINGEYVLEKFETMTDLLKVLPKQCL